MASDHTHHVVDEEAVLEVGRGGGGEEGRLEHLQDLIAEHCSLGGRGHLV